MKEKEIKAIDIEEVDARVYEVGYILLPTIPEEGVPAIYGNLKELISTLGGEVISDEMPRTMPLAYTMVKVIQNINHKFDTGYFGWIKFTMDPAKVLDLKKKIELDTNIIRSLILKTVKENTVAAKRFVRSDVVKHRAPTLKKEGDEVEAPINKEEIDKEIDAMVTV